MEIILSGLSLRTVAYTDPVAVRLVEAALADLGQRYGGDGDGTPVDAAEFAEPGGAFLVAELDGTPVGCGGWRSRPEDPGLAEIKRMYTAPTARGRGVAKAVLAALEDSARRAGKKRVVLETGLRQPEAIELYKSRGYYRIPGFGYYKDHPNARSFAKEL